MQVTAPQMIPARSVCQGNGIIVRLSTIAPPVQNHQDQWFTPDFSAHAHTCPWLFDIASGLAFLIN
jgi:hypothetical protein